MFLFAFCIMIPTGLETGDSCWVPDVAGRILVCFLLILTWPPGETKFCLWSPKQRLRGPDTTSLQPWAAVPANVAVSVTVVLKLSHASESPGSLVQIASSIPQVHGITSGQIDGEIMETVTDFIFLSSKITVDSDCSLEIKTLTPWKKSYDKSR